MRWVTGNKQNEARVGKVLSFKPRVGKVQVSQSTSGFTVIFPIKKYSNLLPYEDVHQV